MFKFAVVTLASAATLCLTAPSTTNYNIKIFENCNQTTLENTPLGEVTVKVFDVCTNFTDPHQSMSYAYKAHKEKDEKISLQMFDDIEDCKNNEGMKSLSSFNIIEKNDCGDVVFDETTKSPPQ
eukprot:Pgem_evm1s19624